MTSKEYWQKRETEHAKKNKMSEQTYAEEIRKTYAYMADQIQKEIDGFYTKYATKEGISLAEAKRRVSKLDIEEYGRKAAKYVKEKDFSDQANECNHEDQPSGTAESQYWAGNGIRIR